jgi:hypothetical protein
MLAEVEASRITTAELEMQTAPPIAAATGVVILPGTSAPPRLVSTKNELW